MTDQTPQPQFKKQAAAKAGLSFAEIFLYIAAIVGIMLCMRLGLWQLDRAEEKTSINIAVAGAAEQAPVINDVLLEAASEYLPVELKGQYQTGLQLILDSQTHEAKAGYNVWSVFKADDIAPLILINRGWVGDWERAPLALPTGAQVIRGRLAKLPKPGLRMGPAVVASPNSQLRVVNYPNQAELEELLANPILPWIVWLDADAPSGFLRNWQPINLPPERHHGYAVQWFAMALAILCITLLLSWRQFRRRNTN